MRQTTEDRILRQGDDPRADRTIEIRRRAHVGDGDGGQDADVAQKETIMTDRSPDPSGPLKEGKMKRMMLALSLASEVVWEVEE